MCAFLARGRGESSCPLGIVVTVSLVFFGSAAEVIGLLFDRGSHRLMRQNTVELLRALAEGNT